MSAIAVPSSRARTGRKRVADDAPYAAPSGAASALKRAANIDDAAPRAKRKRLAPAPTIYSAAYRTGYADASEDDADDLAEDVVRPGRPCAPRAVADPEPRAG
jgi:hypothetical protein